ncbi:hypothetical protein OS493_004792 [Desmophyllum pertusum]|uniref:Uncharacterized protein n=1 Tax=Desmophyllum pertusum TaxID=174260 RepID=A0A9X0CZH1_9CNID|nr:hypothetical protein OS493_004792 [Desmophyllum pertusum]
MESLQTEEVEKDDKKKDKNKKKKNKLDLEISCDNDKKVRLKRARNSAEDKSCKESLTEARGSGVTIIRNSEVVNL